MQNSLVIIDDKKVVTDSLTVADKFEKLHKDVIKKIENIIKNDEGGRLIFAPSSYTNSQNKEQKKYLMDRKSFSILCMSITGKKSLEWKIKFFDAFEKMESALHQILSQKKSSDWISQRQSGKLIHHEKTDVIKKFIEYARSQGSSHAEMYYQNLAKMENQSMFILEQKFKNLRDILSINQLSTVSTADAIAARAIEEGMEKGLHYKEIYQLAKKRVEIFSEIRGKTFIPVFQEKIKNVLFTKITTLKQKEVA